MSVNPAEESHVFGQVIAGVDGKPNGRDAAQLARCLVSRGGRLTLVNIHADDSVYRHGSSDFGEIAREDSLALLAQEQAALGVAARIATVGATSVGAGLHRIAEERDADLLVVGSCSRAAVGRLTLGDNMRAALEGAPCAVAIAPRGFAAYPAARFATIGVAYDGSPQSEAALELARELAHAHSSALIAMTVITTRTRGAGVAPAAVDGEGGDIIDQTLRDAQARLDGLAGVKGRAVQGIAADELACFAEDVDLLVVGSRGYGPLRRMLFGSTSARLARSSRSPLLVLGRGAASQPKTHRADAVAVGATH
jgi:nucleotide-binding universal stress UspA family protein